MAFPTSGLVNNLVHKEGNRAFVYDSALGVWDQVREADSSNNKFLAGSIGSEVTGTLGSGLAFPAGHIIAQSTATLSSDYTNADSTSYETFWSPTYTPNGGPNNTTTIYAYLYTNWWAVETSTSAVGDARKNFKYEVTGSNITNIASGEILYFAGGYNWENTSVGDAGFDGRALKPVTLDGSGNATLTYVLKIANNLSHVNSEFTMWGNGTEYETHIQFWEVV